METRFLSPRELVQLLAVPAPFIEQFSPFPISDPAPDPGLFGPGSTTWQVLREPLLIFAGGRALLMQAAHPHVAQGAIDHSSYTTDPFGRLVRTFMWAGRVVFGTTEEARQATLEVRRRHRPVTGVLPDGHGTPGVRPKSRYAADDPGLLLWVHATFVDTLLEAHQRLVGGLSTDDRDRFVKEWEAVGELMGIPDRLFWPNHAALREYVEREVDGGVAVPGEGSRMVARTVLRPPLPSPLLRPLMDAVGFISVGFLPPQMRRGYELRWTAAHTIAHGTLTRGLRTGRSALPRRLRYAPIYDFAMARCEGRLRPPADGGRAA